MPDITPEMRSKLNLLKAKQQTNEVDDWGKSFLNSVCDPRKTSLSTAQWTTAEKMYARLYAPDKPVDPNKIVRTDRVSAIRSSTGWQLYLDHKAVGVVMTKHEAELVATWFEHSLEMVEYALKQPRPIMTGTKKEEEKDGQADM